MFNDYAMSKRSRPENLGLYISGVSLQHNNFDVCLDSYPTAVILSFVLPFQSSPKR